MTAFYNEIDPFAAQWLRNLIAAGHIASGVVDERDIRDISPDELTHYTQCHFFAGIGVWSLALRNAEWPDDRPVWTGSCPCQPFSAAGRRAGMLDERHLWPAFHHLIEQCRPPVVFGEQVASKDGLGWLDLVQADLEGTGYAVGAADLCAAGVGAPHWRQRLWFVAERLADADNSGLEIRRRRSEQFDSAQGREAPKRSSGLCVVDGRLANTDLDRQPPGRLPIRPGRQDEATSIESGRSEDSRPGPTNGFWRDADWLFCRDGKWRPVEPGTFPLAHGAPARVGRLRAYGNAIVEPAARTFVEAYLDTHILPETP